MEVNLRPDLQARLALLARRQGCDTETVAREAIERRLVDYDGFIRKVRCATAKHGIVLTRAELGARMERLLAKKQSPV